MCEVQLLLCSSHVCKRPVLPVGGKDLGPRRVVMRRVRELGIALGLRSVNFDRHQARARIFPLILLPPSPLAVPKGPECRWAL